MASKSNLSALFKKAAKTFGEAVETAKGVSSDFEDGKYVIKPIGFEIKQAENEAETWGVLFQHRIMDGERKDDVKYEWMNLFDYEDPDQLSRFVIKRVGQLTDTPLADYDSLIEAFQADPDNWLENTLQDAVDEGQVWQAKFRTSKSSDFQNVDLLRQLDASDYPDSEDEAPKGKSAGKSSAKPASEKATKGASGSATSTKKSKAAPKVEYLDANEVEILEGDTVTWTVGKGKKAEEFSGEVTELYVEDETPMLKVQTGGTAKKPIIEEIAAAEVEKQVEGEGEGSSEFEEGDEVTWTEGTGRKAQELTGVIDSIDTDAGTAEVVVGTGKKAETYTVELSDLTKSEPEGEPEGEGEPEEVPFAEGDQVTYSTGKGKNKQEGEGEVYSVDTDDETIEVKIGGTAKKPELVTVPWADAEKVEEGGGEESSYEVGDEVTFEADGEELTGEVMEVDNDAEELTVTVGKGRKAQEYTVPFTDIITAEELEVGQTVEFVNPKTKKEVLGEVVSLNENTGKAKVKVGAQNYDVEFDELTIMKNKE